MKKVTIGPFPNYTIENAREIAAKKYDELVKPLDTDLNPEIEIIIAKEKLTFKTVCNRYLEEYSKLYKKPHTIESDERSINSKLIPEFGEMLADEIKSQNIDEFHAKNSDAPYSANRTLALLSHMFNWAMQMELIEHRFNPCQ